MTSTRSAYKRCWQDIFERSQSISRERTALCRTVYRWRAVGQEQFDRTCLLVCAWPLAQSGHEGSCVRFQRFRFAAVGKTWRKALRAKLKRCAGRLFRVVTHCSMFFRARIRSDSWPAPPGAVGRTDGRLLSFVEHSLAF